MKNQEFYERYIKRYKNMLTRRELLEKYRSSYQRDYENQKQKYKEKTQLNAVC